MSTVSNNTDSAKTSPHGTSLGDANGIYVSDKAKVKIAEILTEKGVSNGPAYFLRVSVVGGGCSGLSYKMDFDNEQKPTDQVFESNGIKVVTDLKSFLYLVNTTLDFSDGLNGKGFYFSNPNASRTCGCGESFAV
jgi:iron-sulfur cluster assembly protein